MNFTANLSVWGFFVKYIDSTKNQKCLTGSNAVGKVEEPDMACQMLIFDMELTKKY